MSRKSATSKMVRKSAAEVPAASQSDLERLRAAMRSKIDSREIPERRQFQRLQRDASGRPQPRKSAIRDAVSQQMRQLHLTVYRLWQLARSHYPPLSQSAVHEFIKGNRQLELPSIEALLAAVNLRIVRVNGAQRGKTRRATKTGANQGALR